MTKINFNAMHPADIKAGLEKRGLTLSDVARRVNCDRRHVSTVLSKAPEVYQAIEDLLAAS